jgi:hypothetical protein
MACGFARRMKGQVRGRTDRSQEWRWLGDGVPVITDDTRRVLYVLSGLVTILG